MKKQPPQGVAVTNYIHVLPSLRVSITRHLNDFEIERTELETTGESSTDARRAMNWLLTQTPRVRGGRL